MLKAIRLPNYIIPNPCCVILRRYGNGGGSIGKIYPLLGYTRVGYRDTQTLVGDPDTSYMLYQTHLCTKSTEFMFISWHLKTVYVAYQYCILLANISTFPGTGTQSTNRLCLAMTADELFWT